MIMMKLLVAACLVFAPVLGQNLPGLPINTGCSPNICMVVSCLSAVGCKGRVEPHGGYCGCCPLCIKQLSAGAKCGDDILAGVVGTHSECGSGLHCDKSSNTCVRSSKRAVGPCKLALHKAQGSPLLGVSSPKCDTDGNYAAKQCKGGGCYCVDKEGTDLGYFNPYGSYEQKMTCDCARDKTEYFKTGLIGKLFFCDNQGNYAENQSI